MTREEAIEMWVIPALKKTWNEKRCNEVIEALDDIYERLGLIRYDPNRSDENIEDFKEIADIIYVDTDSIKIEKEDDNNGC